MSSCASRLKTIKPVIVRWFDEATSENGLLSWVSPDIQAIKRLVF